MNRIRSKSMYRWLMMRLSFLLRRVEKKTTTMHSYLSARPPSHRSETTIGSNTSSLPDIVKPRGPLKEEERIDVNHLQDSSH